MPFTYLGREKQYEGRAFNVAKIQLQLPDGRERRYDLVEHGDSVTILPVDSAGQLYFVTQYRVGSGDMLLELPAGVLEAYEDPLTCARREIREEIGMAAREMKALGGFYLAPGYTDEYMTVFLASGLYDSPLKADDDEFLNISTLSIKESYRMAQAGEIEDGKTLAALLLAQPLINSLT